MEGLRIVLIIIGAIAIGAILIHGLWSIRKQSAQQRKRRGEVTLDRLAADSDGDGFDQDGIGRVRVISGSASRSEAVGENGAHRDDAHSDDLFEPVIGQRVEPQLGVPTPDGQPRSKGRVEKVEPRFSIGTSNEESAGTISEQVDLFAEPMDSAVDDPEPESFPSKTGSAAAEPHRAKANESESVEAVGEPQEVLILNVVAGASGPLQGAVMLPCLLTLGLKFGEMSIFHRHESPAGTGPVLFSIANMVKPGTFDPEGMESFSTQGISLFMTLPCHGEAQKNFALMLKAAEQLAAEMRGQVLDDQRNVLTRQKIQYYQERIREFERKRLLAV